MLNIKLKCQKEEFYTLFLNICRNNLQVDFLIIPAGISSPSSATMIIIVKNMDRNEHSQILITPEPLDLRTGITVDDITFFSNTIARVCRSLPSPPLAPSLKKLPRTIADPKFIHKMSDTIKIGIL
jgi:hypothetical protein